MPVDLEPLIPAACFAFRGYNVTNLGRSHELLTHPVYGETVKVVLKEASKFTSEATGRRIDLAARVRKQRQTTLKTFADAIGLIVGMEVAQVRLLKEFFGIEYHQSKLAIGYSLGEVSAAVCGGVLQMGDAIGVTAALADDCAELGEGTAMGIVFSRGPALDVHAIRKLCVEINQEGHGVIGVSAHLSPNSLLVLGQDKTVDRFNELRTQRLPKHVHLRKNKSHWPPLHTPIMWQRSIPNRAAVMLHTVQGGLKPPQPPIASLVTGKVNYNDFNARDILNRWIDHPQRVWDGVYETLSRGVETIIHVGPEPNLFPATFKRLSDNLQVQLQGRSAGSLGKRVVSGMARRPWLTAVLPSRTALFRAPFLQHVILEDWLLEQKVK
ncbi:MAG: ACP S-malonyltransferase [Planctomycetota bacterium]|nr:ACP S-malonyltransferase [Planctomycetota bacterium]